MRTEWSKAKWRRPFPSDRYVAGPPYDTRKSGGTEAVRKLAAMFGEMRGAAVTVHPNTLANLKMGGEAWRGRLRVPRNKHHLVVFMVEEANRQGKLLTEIAGEARLSPRTLRSWARNIDPTVPHLERALDALGFEMTVRKKP